MKKHKVDHLFSKKLGNHETKALKTSWESMEALLNKADKKDRKPVWWYWSAAAVVLLSVGIWFGSELNRYQQKSMIATLEPEKDSLNSNNGSLPIENKVKKIQTEVDENKKDENIEILNKNPESPSFKMPFKPKKVRVTGYYTKSNLSNPLFIPADNLKADSQKLDSGIAAETALKSQEEQNEVAIEVVPLEGTGEESNMAEIEFRPRYQDKEVAEVSFRSRPKAMERLWQKMKAIGKGESSIKDLGINRQNLIALVRNQYNEE